VTLDAKSSMLISISLEASLHNRGSLVLEDGGGRVMSTAPSTL
jgi:hypothetical protein